MRDAIAGMGLQLSGRDHPFEKTMPTNRTPVAPVNITISIGAADNSGDVNSPEIVLEMADAALYQAKEDGKNCVRVEAASV